MPKYLDPITKPTKAQWKAIVRRLLDKEGRGPLTKPVIDKIMQTEPPVEVAMGRLERRALTGRAGEQIAPGRFLSETTPRIENLPIEEARAKYFANPQQYTTPSMIPEPPVKVLEQLPPGPESGTFARDIAYTRQKFEPIIPPGMAHSAGVLRREAEEGAVDAALGRMGLGPEDVRPELPIKQFLRSKGVNVQDEVPAIADVLQTAVVADTMWKMFAGERTPEGMPIRKLWEAYRQASNIGAKFTSGRDYFTSSFSRWRQDPGKFSKKYPREAKQLKRTWDAFQAEFSEGVE